MVCAVFTGGVAFWYQEMDQEVLWTPYNSPVRVTVKVEVLKDVFFSSLNKKPGLQKTFQEIEDLKI